MKKNCLVLFALLLTALLSVTAVSADVIFVPSNSFFEKHNSEIQYLGRTFIADGPEGRITGLTEPGKGDVVGTIANGDAVWVGHTYNLDGQLWGLVNFDVEPPEQEEKIDSENSEDSLVPEITPSPIEGGWIPLNQMQVKYDYISFDEAHRDEYYDYTGDYSEFPNGIEIQFYAWPGSGAPEGSMERMGEDLVIDKVYKDAGGREWGFLNYYYGYRNVWVSITDPGNSNIPADTDNPATGGRLPQPSPSKNPLSTEVIAILLVAAVVVGTALLIKFLWKPRKS